MPYDDDLCRTMVALRFCPICGIQLSVIYHRNVVYRDCSRHGDIFALWRGVSGVEVKVQFPKKV